MSLVDGNNLSTWEGGLFDRDNDDSVSLLFRLLWIFTHARAEGVNISLNEAGRPFGVFSDIDVGRAGQGPGSTFSGRSTVCYQYGRYLLWLATGGAQGTPSAANPYSGVYASQHTRGRAADIDCDNYGRLDQLAERVGMKRTISSEIWHYEPYRDPDPDIDFGRFSAVVNRILGGTTTAGEHSTPIDNRTPEQKEWDNIMTNADDLNNTLKAILAALSQPADDATKLAVIVRNYSAEKGTNVASALIYPYDGTALRLNSTMDVTALEVAHIQVFGIMPTGWDQGTVPTRYASQLDDNQWRLFWKAYPYPMRGFTDDDFPKGDRPKVDGVPKGA